jgi:hypothetical protein
MLLFPAEMKLKFPILNTSINVSVEDTNGERRRRNRKKKKAAPDVAAVSSDTMAEADINKDGKEKEMGSEEPAQTQQPVLMVKVENVVHEKFQQTEEVKVLILISTRSFVFHQPIN